MGERDPNSGDALPEQVARLLAAKEPSAVAAAWQAFLATYSGLLLQVARSIAAQHDAAMDAYTFLLERLRENDCRRLRVYNDGDGARFSTWLLVVARRLCIDFHRQRYGRPQGAAEPTTEAAVERTTRRRLVDLTAEAIDVDSLSDERGQSPDSHLRVAQLRQALGAALETLDASDRLLLAMRFEDGRAAAAIAKAMGFPTPFHVYRRLSLVLSRLRTALSSRGIDDPTP